MKVATPAWLVDSATQGVLLNWKDYIFRPGGRTEGTQGRQSGQTSLARGMASQKAKAGGPSQAPRLAVFQQQDGRNTPRTLPVGAEIQNIGHPTEKNTTPESSRSDTDPVSRPGATRADPYSSADSLAGPSGPSAPTTPSEFDTTPIDPVAPGPAARAPGYAFHKSNLHAQRAMADPAWRAAHTSAAPDFIEGYYRNSRLHHLSMWKSELRGLVMEAQERAEQGIFGGTDNGEQGPGTEAETGGVSMRGSELVPRLPLKKMVASTWKGKGKAREDATERVIMHCDFDSFFVSAGLIDRPELRDKPAVVCHSQGAQGGASSTSEIASASYEARKFGIKGGMR